MLPCEGKRVLQHFTNSPGICFSLKKAFLSPLALLSEKAGPPLNQNKISMKCC